MKSIEEQIEALTQELRPYPETRAEWFWYFSTSDDESFVDSCLEDESEYARRVWRDSEFCSFNKAEVEEYADCYRRLRLYQLIGEKKKKEFSLNRVADSPIYGTDFLYYIDLGVADRFSGRVTTPNWKRHCVLGGVWFAREEDRLEALKICGIDAEFQKKCAKYGLGGA